MVVRIYCGDCRNILTRLPKGQIQVCVTSPPYFHLRDYGIPGQVGLENSPERYIESLTEVFRLVRDALRPDGTLWVNIGDSYAANRTYQVADSKHRDVGNSMPSRVPIGMKPKDLMMIPAHLAISLRADGWYLRSDIIWDKSINVMPESIKDRPTAAHEHVFLLSRQARYYYDCDGVRIPFESKMKGKPHSRQYGTKMHGMADLAAQGSSGAGFARNPKGKNLRNVWSIATQPLADAHFASFPPALVEPCLKAGASLGGACGRCHAPLVRREVMVESPGDGLFEISQEINATRWEPSCDCHEGTAPSVVLDPFFGAGTTGLVAERLGMDCWGIELNPEYVDVAVKRLEKHQVAVEVIEIP